MTRVRCRSSNSNKSVWYVEDSCTEMFRKMPMKNIGHNFHILQEHPFTGVCGQSGTWTVTGRNDTRLQNS